MQGPHSLQVLELLGLPGELAYMSFVTGTGGTARRGDRLPHRLHRRARLRAAGRAERAGELWDALLEAGQDPASGPAGSGARDTLRTEMGYPLHGHELSLEITPNQARSGWAVGWKKPAFWGREALLAEKEAGPGPAAVGAARDRPRDPAAGHGRCSVPTATAIGEVTSGTFSPTPARRDRASRCSTRGRGRGGGAS